MSTTVDSFAMSHAATACHKSKTPVGGCAGPAVFNKTMKYEPSSMVGLPKMSSQTSLLDVIRSQGHAILGVEDPIQPRTALPKGTSSMRKELSSSSSLNKHPKSKPIRIVNSHHHHRRHDGGVDGSGAAEDDPLSTSAELERFYDQATWRMYILIQSARLANDSALPAPGHGRVPTTPHSHAPYRHHHHHSTHPYSTTASTRSSAATWTTHCPSATSSSIDSEEDIFDLEL